MKWKEIITDYFTFTRRERIGIFVILVMIITLAFSPVLFRSAKQVKPVVLDSSWITTQSKPGQKTFPESKEYEGNENNGFAYEPSKADNYNKPGGELFYFDPNTLSAKGWQKLGLREKTVSTIENYISKGGRFKKPEDLQRVYGLRKNEYARLAPFIKINFETGEKSENNFSSNTSLAEDRKLLKPIRSFPIDINTADTSAFISLPGIGSKLANRIVNFREKLGGFYAVEQVGETFGLPDSTFKKIERYLELKNSSIRKLNINKVTTEELKSHPYFKGNLAGTLVAFRNEHGPFSKIDEIKKIMLITDEVYKRVSPYLSVQ